jgi:hypothetical protein
MTLYFLRYNMQKISGQIKPLLTAISAMEKTMQVIQTYILQSTALLNDNLSMVIFWGEFRFNKSRYPNPKVICSQSCKHSLAMEKPMAMVLVLVLEIV